MLLLPQVVEVKWHNRTRKWYENQGYKYTKLWDIFLCDVNHLYDKYQGKVKFICDYCNEVYIRQYDLNVTYFNKSNIKKDCCIKKECKKQKSQESVLLEYGVHSILLLDRVRESSIKARKYTFDFVKETFENKDLVLIDDEYVDCQTPLKCYCLIHKEKTLKEPLMISLENILRRDSGCKYCGYERNSGEKNYRWKGGITSLSRYLRDFLKEWKLDVFKYYNFRCTITNEKSNELEVHHVISSNSIIQKIIADLNFPIYKNVGEYSSNQLEMIKEAYMDSHNVYMGVILKAEVHKLFHTIYGYGNNTPEQFEEFKINYINGVYSS